MAIGVPKSPFSAASDLFHEKFQNSMTKLFVHLLLANLIKIAPLEVPQIVPCLIHLKTFPVVRRHVLASLLDLNRSCPTYVLFGPLYEVLHPLQVFSPFVQFGLSYGPDRE